jgi:ABC-type polysaccharide/polyol phosphate export permease
MIPAGGRIGLTLYMARMELDRRHAGSFGGVVWAYFGPVATIVVMWLALDFGLGMRAVLGPGFGHTLIVGLAAWFFFSEALNSATSAITGNPHLVKKVVFPVALLPLVSVLAGLAVHAAVLTCVIGALAFDGALRWASLGALPFWIALTFVFAWLAGLVAAGLNAVARDTAAIVPNLAGLWFWATPIVWPLSTVPEAWRWLALANPMAVLVEGYRSALLGGPAPLDGAGLALFCCGLGLAALGAILVFRRLRPLFADSL